MKTESHSHNGAKGTIKRSLIDGMEKVLTDINFKIYQGCSRKLREVIMDGLTPQGWSGKIEITEGTKISITSTNDNCGLCLQTGNMSRFYADILKLECLHKKKKIKAAFFIIPSKDAAKKMGSNIAHFKRLVQELEVFKDVVTIPILVISIS